MTETDKLQSDPTLPRPEADPAVLLAWIETKEDLETIHRAAKVRFDRLVHSHWSSSVLAVI